MDACKHDMVAVRTNSMEIEEEQERENMNAFLVVRAERCYKSDLLKSTEQFGGVKS